MSTVTAPPSPKKVVPQGDPTLLLPKKLVRSRPLFDPEIVGRATKASFLKLNPVTLMKNPVMFVVEVGAALTTVFLIRDLFTGAAGTAFFIARLPATANMGIMIRKRPISIANPIVRLYQGVLALIPAKALPLFPVPLEYA